MSQSASTTQAAPAALETIANNVSPRAFRYGRRGLLWRESNLPRVRSCGRVAVTPGGLVALRLKDGAAGLAGLASCGSVWADPVCNAKIMSRRALEIGAGIALWQSQGGAVAFGTFTMRHNAGHGLAALWDALSLAYRKVIAGKAWGTDKARYGVAGFVRVVEVTYGRNGWHVHIHALFFLRSPLAPEALASWHHGMVGRWTRALERDGFTADMRGQDLRIIDGPADTDLARYFTKAVDTPRALGVELTHSQGKRARTALGTSPVWVLLDEVAQGDADALDRWHEWEKGSKGRRQIGWSKGLRSMLLLDREESDEEIASEEVGSTEDDLLYITSEGWAALVRTPANIGHLLDAVEAGGLRVAREFLARHGIEHEVKG